MYRSSSSGRVSDEFFPYPVTSPTPAFSSPNPKSTSSGALDELPSYHPQSQVAKKDRSRLRFAENAIHLIPLVLVLSAIILWFFSSPVQMLSKGDSNVVRVNTPVIYSKIGAGRL
ncbi:unnamed protein product [Cuscuta epithymum]|uniref:Transmembrane protein n=1 Tax=Cuscuta epithymum TaxID=186058 RepID=A0AAV0CNQ6_9ASTE|nr:unnamed protein product [Cuscuta epithymum]CAH9134164.1 unnamed protein product [Cuscuta epithymum]